MFEKNFGHAPRLPDDIRDQLNQRLLDGQSASTILPWLNDLTPVKDVLAAQFSGEPVTAQNLSNWRIGGYQHWLRDQKDLCQIKKFGDHAAGLSSTYHHNLAAGTLTVASARIFQSLQSTIDDPLSATDICKIARAAVSLQRK